MIYFDSAATSIPKKEVLEVYQKVANNIWYNPSSMHKLGIIAKNYIDKASETILHTLDMKEKKIYYTSGATEANNMAIYGICNKYIGANKHIITTMIEHPSVYNVFNDLEKKGFRVTYLRCVGGVVDIKELKEAITKDTILISIMWVNNIIGSIQPLDEIIQTIRCLSHAKIHVDAVQGIGKMPFNFNQNDVDMLTLTSHKIGGLKGTGLLIANKNICFESIIKGGHQQENMRAGTMDVAGIVALSKAISLAYRDLNYHYYYVKELNSYFKKKLENFSFIKINEGKTVHSPYVLSISFEHVKGETAMHYLEQLDIYVGIGSACNERQKTLERAIMSITLDETRAINMIRISLSEQNTREEIDQLINGLKQLERI